MIIISQKLLNVLTFNNGKVCAMALWPFILLNKKELKQNLPILNHEKIHHRQQLELLLLPFYIWYFVEYWIGMFKYKFVHQKAYMNISFEKEAYANQNNLEYLKKRKWLASWQYF